jgi:H+/Cl- antiporter ClcA
MQCLFYKIEGSNIYLFPIVGYKISTNLVVNATFIYHFTVLVDQIFETGSHRLNQIMCQGQLSHLKLCILFQVKFVFLWL